MWSEVILDELLDLFGFGAIVSCFGCTFKENLKCWHVCNLLLHKEIFEFVSIHVDESNLFVILLSEFLHVAFDSLAGTTPFSRKLHKCRFVTIYNFMELF